jgi:isopentenyl-diphosphate delta-isomerase
VLLVDPQGRVLLQQRAAVKTRFPLRWGNSCCGHPTPGQSLTDAANRRLREELGAAPVALTEIGVHLYYAEDPGTGRIEFEYDHVLRGELSPDDPLLPDPDEVANLRWVDPAGLAAEINADPQRYAPWLGGVIDRVLRPDGVLTAPAPSGHPPAGPPAASRSGSAARVDDTPERPSGC